jgi:ABC-2 type transport system ATP-binding protein
MLNSSSSIAVEELDVVRGGRKVLGDVTFTVPAGTVTGLLGPSGCGKTTLMRCVVGVQRITGGSVSVLGHPAGTPGLRRRIGYVTQAPSVYADLTVADNARYFAAIQGVGRDQGDWAIERVGLRDRRSALVRQLSGGERARASLACALLARPELLILDEPTVGLDPLLRRELWRLFGELAADGATLLVSSHVMDEADRCERLLLMRDGRVLADTDPQALRDETGERDLEAAFVRMIERSDRLAVAT